MRCCHFVHSPSHASACASCCYWASKWLYSWSVTATHPNSGENSCAMNPSSPGLPSAPASFPQWVLELEAVQGTTAPPSWLGFTDSLYFPLGFVTSQDCRNTGMDWQDECYGFASGMWLTLKSMQKNAGLGSAPALLSPGSEWAEALSQFHTVSVVPLFLPWLSHSGLQLSKPFVLPVPLCNNWVISGFEKLEVTLTPCPAVVVSGLQAKWHLFGSWRSHPAIAWRGSLQVQSICNASVSKDLLQESL